MNKKRIIVVEDEGIVAMDISKCLSGLGYDIVLISDSGEKTLEELENLNADLILMDVELKGTLNGLETTKIIKEKFSIPVVFLTAFEDDATLQKISKLSSDGYLVKPFEDEQLKSTVESVLGS
jgi:CheY-like chemotaxis protein